MEIPPLNKIADLGIIAVMGVAEPVSAAFRFATPLQPENRIHQQGLIR
ncbi:hypothetical protein [Syntrophus gentianae]|nr:hypothetical protein [Syntrophus gentianae]